MAPTKALSKRPCATTKKVAPNPITFRKAKKEKQEKQIFKGLTMSYVGLLKHTRGNNSLEDISRWIHYHGGVFENEVTDETTHLICSIEEYNKGGAQVKRAWKLGTRKCQIVVFDWIEDCLTGKVKRRLKEKPYTLDRTIMNLKKMTADKVREHRKKFEDGARVARELISGNLYHIYYDSDAFEYKVMLSRVRLDGKIMIEKYTLYLFESHIKAPPLYMFGAKLSRTCRPIIYYRQDCHPMDFFTAFQCLKKFFKEKSGIEWDDRLERLTPKKMENGKEVEFSFFKYLPPIQGRPVGLLPYGYVRPEDRQREVAADEDGKVDGEVVADRDGDVDRDVGYDTDSDAGDDEDGENGRDGHSSDEDRGSDTSGSRSGEGSTASGAESNGIISITSTSDGSDFQLSSFDTPSFLRDTPSAPGSPDGRSGTFVGSRSETGY